MNDKAISSPSSSSSFLTPFYRLVFLLSVLLLSAAALDCSKHPLLSCTPGPAGFRPGSGFATFQYGDSFVAAGGGGGNDDDDDEDVYWNQVGDLYLPALMAQEDDPSTVTANSIPVVVLLHGGYWKDNFRRNCCGSSMVPLAVDLQQRGFAVVNLEYRRVAPMPYGPDKNRGGVPGTLNDVSAGVNVLHCLNHSDELATMCDGFSSRQQRQGLLLLNLDKVAVVGHSAGGHLALWKALQYGIDPNNTNYGIKQSKSPGVVQPVAAVGLAAVSDLQGGCIQGTASCSAIANFLGVDSLRQLAAVSPVTSPIEMLAPAAAAARADTNASPLHFYLAHGSDDGIASPRQSQTFAAAAAAAAAATTSSGNDEDDDNSDSRLIFRVDPDSFKTFRGEDHFDVIDPTSTSWTTGVVPFLERVLMDF